MTETRTRASLASQLGGEPCAVEDTEEIFWLRESDNYQSRFRLGSALAAQYRFREAVSAFQSALRLLSCRLERLLWGGIRYDKRDRYRVF